MMSSGMTKDRSIWKLNAEAVRLRHRWMPMAKATPIGTATSVVSSASRRVWNSAVWRSGSCHTERSGSL